MLALVKYISRNGPVYARIPYRNFFLLLNFIPALISINIRTYYTYLSFSISSDGIYWFHF